MKLGILPVEFTVGKPIIDQLEHAGFEAYFVGGSVRDSLLGQDIHDVDIATSAYPAEVKKLFSRTVDIGIDHGTVLVLHHDEEYEVTTFRTESTYQDYRRPDEVTFVRSLAEDLKRRDFTINALAMDKNGDIIDLFAGQTDLKNQVIRAVGEASERFNEDALRMMRALRFASQLNFDIETDTLAAISEHHALLGKISVERVRIEYLKLMAGKNRLKGLVPFIETDCYQYCPGMKGRRENLTALSHLLPIQLSEEAQIWLLTMKILGFSTKDTRSILTEWKNSNQLINRVVLLLAALNFRLESAWTPAWLFKLGEENLQLIEETLPFFEQSGDTQGALKLYAELPIKKNQDLAVSGKELLPLKNGQGGPWLGNLLEDMKQAVLIREVANEEASLLDFAKKYLSEREGLLDGHVNR